MAKFSIIIPLYNKERFIKETLDSLLGQTFCDFEAIVVDDGSTDRSLEIVESISDSRIIIIHKKNEGVSVARNVGINHAKGEVICFLDSDDIWLPTYLEVLNKNIDNFPEAGLFCSAYFLFTDDVKKTTGTVSLKWLQKEECSVIDFFSASNRLQASIALTSSVAVRRNVISLMPSWFTEGVNMGEDVDFWVRVALLTTTVYNNTPLMLYRCDTQGLSFSGQSISSSYPYWTWYERSNNILFRQFTTRMVYLLARKGYFNGDYKYAIMILSKAKGSYLIVKRGILFFVCLCLLIVGKWKQRKLIMTRHL